MGTERREERRFRLSRMVAYDMGKERYLHAKGSDISRTGMSFLSDEYIDSDTSVWLSFSVPELDGTWRHMEAEGRVVSVSDLPIGCRFAVTIWRMEPDERAAYEAFITRLEADGQGAARAGSA